MFALKDLVSKGKTVRFVALMAGSIWYETEDGFAFPVPLSETDGATFLAEDKALFYMRFIRVHLPVASGLEAGLARSHSPAVSCDTVRFVHFKDMQMVFSTTGGFEFPVGVTDRDVVCATEPASRFTKFWAEHHAMLEEARQAA
jgi:hypothetical protein